MSVDRVGQAVLETFQNPEKKFAPISFHQFPRRDTWLGTDVIANFRTQPLFCKT
ncbi:hypothetical protein RISK_005571 [Rhodopirellula islandica]|uniref:Uncharacterized protein n=1 Tax=Rhodopirellula islandica TaxID=595434 RepID=A0A0J1B6Q7_RHOIS|nr:hypothetical protein RISK_005571 [Rhodopirellula islandica]